METLRKLSSMRRSKDSSKEVAKIVEQQPQASEEEQPPQDELLNGGATTAENNETTTDPPVAPSPPRARVTDDVDDDVEDVAGDDDGYDSAVDKMGTSSTSSVVEEPVAPRAAEPSASTAQASEKADETDETETEDQDNADSPRTPSGSGSGNGAEAEAEADEDEVDEEDDGKLSRQASRVMPVAKLSPENDEQDEDVDIDDDEEVDIEEEYEEANDQVLFEDDDAASVTQEGDSPPRIIARETADDQFEAADTKPSSEMEEEVEQAASTPLPDQADDLVEKSINTEATDTTTPQVAEEETEEKSEEETEEKSDEASPAEDDDVADVVKEEDSSDVVQKSTPEVTSDREDEDSSDVVEKSTPEVTSDREDEDSSDVVEKPTPEVTSDREDEDSSDVVQKSTPEVTSDREDEDSSDVVEKPTPDVTSDREDEGKLEEDEEVLQQATSQLAEPEPVDIGVKEADAPEVVPLATAEVGNVLKESDGEETAEDVVELPREASSSLTEELPKLSESRSLHEQSADSEEVVPADVTDTEAPDELSQSVGEPEEESATVSEPVTVVESQPSASNSLEAELKKLSDARLEREASEASEASAKSAEETTLTTGKEEEEEEQGPESADFSVPEEVEPAQKVIEPDEGVPKESLDELKELTYGFHMQGRPESEASEMQSALIASPEEKDTTDSSSVAVSETHSPLVAEVKILEQSDSPEEEEPASATVKEELSKEEVGSPAVVPSPANLYTALKAVDDELPPLKSENGNAGGDTGNVQVKPRGFSAADFTGDSDGEDEDDENEDDDDEDDDDDQDEELDTAKALAELANAVQKSGNVSESGTKPSMGAAGPSLPSLPQRPAVRKSAVAATALDTAGRITQRPAVTSSTQLATTTDESANGESAEVNETREKLQNIRVKFLRLAHRLGQSPQNVVVAQVLYRLGLAESLRGGNVPNRAGAFSFDRANALAEEQEAANQEEELDFACTILVLGKTGVGKSATINSIFDDRKSATSAFDPSTTKVQEIVGTVHGIKVRVIDTPGLLPSVADQQHNERIMGQVKKHIKKASPDIVLYFDRLDMQSRDYGDLPLLRTITDLFGAAVWFNAIVVLTHASSAPPDGPNGVPLSYEMFVAQRSHVVQQTIRQAAGDMRLMNPVSLVENHPACRTNRNGQRVLPNGQIWKPQLLLLCFASKILAEANSLLKLQETATPGRPFGQRSRVPPLPFLLSSLLQSRAQLKLPDEQLGESDESDDEEEEDDSDADDYDELPPFRPLSKEELEELDNEQKQDYMDEIADRERLFQKKQYREEMRRRKEMKKRAAQMSKEELAQPGDDPDDEAGKAAAVPVPMPDMALPPSFDSDNPTHRYRYLETANQWLVRPVLETHGWDHDAGYDGFNVEKMFVVKDKVPASISGQVTKDKKEAQVNFEAAASLKHGEGKVTLTGFDIQTIGKDLAYTLRAETRFNNFKRNKTTAGLTCTVLNDTIAAGLKLEDRILIGKRIKMVVNGGVLTGKGDKAFGGSLEATLRGKEYPLSRTLSTLGLSVMDWHGDLAIGGNLQSQFMVGKTMLVGRANLNNRGSGQLSVRASSSEQLQMVLIGIVPILRSLINCRFGFGGQSSQ